MCLHDAVLSYLPTGTHLLAVVVIDGVYTTKLSQNIEVIQKTHKTESKFAWAMLRPIFSVFVRKGYRTNEFAAFGLQVEPLRLSSLRKLL